MRKSQGRYVVVITVEAAGPRQLRKGTRLRLKDLPKRKAQVFIGGWMAAVGTVDGPNIHLTSVHQNAGGRKK